MVFYLLFISGAESCYCLKLKHCLLAAAPRKARGEPKRGPYLQAIGMFFHAFPGKLRMHVVRDLDKHV